MYFGYMDYSYVIYVLPAVLLSLIASIMVKSAFSRYDRVESKRHLTGAQVAEFLLKINGITDVRVTHISGQLTDNYNPSKKTLNLSSSTYSSSSIAAIGVAAHETGHAIQHHVGYAPLGLRSSLVPVANIGSNMGPVMAVAGILIGGVAKTQTIFSVAQIITDAGLVLFGLAVLFYIVTLPVEFNASRRALKQLKAQNILDKEELFGVSKVLSAAAMTYVASALVAIGNLLRLLVITGRRSDRR